MPGFASMERSEVRIVAGRLRGRKLVCLVHEGMRPTPQMVREALFSILGNAIPDRVFYDVFSGTGVVGLEAISRGATRTVFVERDGKLTSEIQAYAQKFGVAEQTQIVRSDVYRWVDRWIPGDAPVNVFLSPPFPDLAERLEDFLRLVETLQQRLPLESVLVIQAEDGFAIDRLKGEWDCRKYGRNRLLIQVKDSPPPPASPSSVS